MKDFFYRRFSHLNFRRIEECRKVIRWLQPSKNEKILDIGCGDGFYDYKMARDGANIVGVDLNQKRLAVAAKRNKTERIEYHSMNAEQLDFKDASFDKAVSFCVIEHFNDDRQVLNHVRRLLKPGGRFVFSADSLSNPEITVQERARHQRLYAVNNFYTIESVKQKLTQAELSFVKAEYILTGRLTLALVRLSWWLDELPPRLPVIGQPIRILGYCFLWTIGMGIAAVSELLGGRKNSGLTLIVEAVK
jgi:ubiquinone/menaquinone biosynthesis C-methylase UbiE